LQLDYYDPRDQIDPRPPAAGVVATGCLLGIFAFILFMGISAMTNYNAAGIFIGLPAAIGIIAVPGYYAERRGFYFVGVLSILALIFAGITAANR